MLPLALWAPPSLQLHQAFSGTALAADTPEDHFSVHRRWTLPGAHRLTTERPLHTLSSSQHPAPVFPYPPGLLGSPVGSELPLGWGSSYTSSPHDSPSVPSQPSPDSRCHVRAQVAPWPLSAGHLLGAKPSFPFIPEEWQLLRPLCFCTDHICHLQGGLGHRRRRTLPTFLSVPFSPRTSGSALWSPTLGARPVMAVNVPSASESPRWD